MATITEDYAPRYIVFKRINEKYGEHEPSKTLPVGTYSYDTITSCDEYSGIDLDRISQFPKSLKGWVFERLDIDDLENPPTLAD